MNKRNLALLISKHPLLRKLTEDKTIPNSVVARLIVEELMEAERETLSNKLTKLLAKGNPEDREKIIVDFFKVLKTGQGYEGLFPTWPKMSEEKKQAFIEAGKKFDITKGRAKQFTGQIIAATTPQEIQSGTEKLIDDVEAQTGIDLDNTHSTAGKEITLTPEHESIQRQLKAVLKALGKKAFYLKRTDGSYSEVVDIMFWPTSAVPLLKDKGHPQYNAPGLDKDIVHQQGVSKMASDKPLWNEVYKAKNHSWVFFIDPEKIQERLGTSKTYKVYNDVTMGELIQAKIFLSVEKFEKLKGKTAVARQELDIEPIAKKFGEYEYFKSLNDEQKKVIFKFIALLKRNELFENLDGKTSLVKTLRNLGVKGVPNMEVILQYMTEPEQQTVQDILSNQDTSIEKFLAMLKKAELVPSPNQEPGKKEKPSTPMKGKPVAIDPAQAGAFVGAANELLNDFYNQKYRKDQATIVGKVIDSMKAFVEDADLALAFGKPPADKPEEQEATSEEPPKEQEATSEEPKPLAEQEGEEVKADKDEMRNIRIGLRSFLSRVNKTNKYLTEFQKVAGAGSVLSDAYKKKFMDNLKEIQTAIYRLALVLNKMLDSKEELNEKKGSETMNKWREVQKLYDLSIKSVSSVKELLDTETPPDELDSTLTNDAYTALISLAGHFPSVAPFGAGKMKRSNFGEYKVKFGNAIGQVKSDLQNVFNLIKTGEAGEESLQNARDGLRDFGDAIASIFGVPSRFKDAKVKPGDDKAPAVQEDPEAEKKPEEEEEKYTDEISEEDKELLSAALDEDKEYYQKATKRLKELNLDRAEDMGFVPEVPLSEIMKKTEDLIQDLESAKQRIQIGEKSLEKVGDSVTPKGKKRKEILKKSLQRYIELYEKIQDSIRSGDMSSILDTNPVRVEKVQKLIDISKRYLDEKAAMNNLFVAVINNAFGEKPNLKLIWDALKDANGKEAERLTGDMKNKIARAGKNIKNTILKSFEPEKLDFSSFKKFVGMVADKVSKTAIQLDNKLNEEDIELEPTPEDKKRAEKEKADERDAPFKEKELKIYQQNFDKALQEMKSFVALYNAFDYAMDQIENEVGRTKFLEAFDKDFSTVKGLLATMDNHLKKVSKMFGDGTPSLKVAKEYGFPPSGFIEGEEEKTINSALIKQFKLEKLKKESGMSDKQVRLYAELLVELDKAKVINLQEKVDVNKIKAKDIVDVIKKKFDSAKQKQLKDILGLPGVPAHLDSVYKGDFEPGEFEVISDEDPDPLNERIEKLIKPLIREMLTKGK